MSTALLRFILMLSFANPMAVVLSHKMVVGGCGYPKSAKIVRRPAACWPPVKSAAYSASPADATTHGMIVEIADMVPLTRVGWCSLPRKKMQPTTDPAFERDR
jgi:hypothetical protein